MTREEFVQEALKYLGYPASSYRGAEKGQSEDGFDCSGFVTFVLKKFGLSIPEWMRHSNEYFDHLGIFIHEEFRQKGDLVFFTRNGFRPTHMGIMVSYSEFIHSPGKDGKVITVAQLKKKIIKPREGQIYNVNPIGFKRFIVKVGDRYQPRLFPE